VSDTASSLVELARTGTTERRRLAAAVLLGFGAVAAAGGLLVTSGYLISRAAQRPDILTLTVAIVAVRAFAIARAVLRYGERLASHDAALRLLGRVRARFYARLAPLVPGDLGGPLSGDLLSRFVGDVDTLQDFYLRALAPPIVAALVICGASVAAWLVLPPAAPVLFACLLLASLVVPAIAGGLAASAGRRQAPARAALSAELVETIDGAAELTVARRGPERVARLAAADARLATIAHRDALAAGASTALATLASGLTVIAVLAVAIPAVERGALGGVMLAGLVFLVLATFEGIVPLSLAARRLHACAAAARRLDDLCEREPAVCDPCQPVRLPATGDLVVSGVWASYGSSQPWILEGANLRLAPGRCVVLRGASGSGKTTLARLLVRFRDPEAGSVTLGGVDVRCLTQDDLRRTVLIAAQDAHLFNTTLRENILLARRDATDADVWRALEAAEAAAWVRSLAAGLDTLAGEDGAVVSGGERRRIALARALLADARFLILDEPTAHLDAETAGRVMRNIVRASKGRGVLVITHSDAGLEAFDEVLELRAGRIETVRTPPAVAQRTEPRTIDAQGLAK
jgi:ATP-binding cassette, subfamily C, bacterial CydC